MSLIRPGIDAQHLINRAMGAQNLGTLGRIEDAADDIRFANLSRAAQNAEINRLARRYETDKLRNVADDILTKLGYLVHHKDDDTRIIEKYDSNWVNLKLKQAKINASEPELLKGVTKIKGDCNLRGTKIADLSSLKKIGGTLTVDVASDLKNLSGIEEVLGSVMVHVKNKADAKSFLKSIGLNLEAVKGSIIPVIKNYL